MSSTPQIIGISDEVTTCDCCGRTGLKRTVHLHLEDDGDIYYGTTCAARAFPKLGPAAGIADVARRMCACGCGEFANRITASGRRFVAGHSLKVSA